MVGPHFEIKHKDPLRCRICATGIRLGGYELDQSLISAVAPSGVDDISCWLSGQLRCFEREYESFVYTSLLFQRSCCKSLIFN